MEWVLQGLGSHCSSSCWLLNTSWGHKHHDQVSHWLGPTVNVRLMQVFFISEGTSEFVFVRRIAWRHKSPRTRRAPFHFGLALTSKARHSARDELHLCKHTPHPTISLSSVTLRKHVQRTQRRPSDPSGLRPWR